MYFKCDISKINAAKLAEVLAIDTLYSEQSMLSIILALEPLTFELKPQLSATMRERLIAKRVPAVLAGYVGKIEGNTLVIQKEAAAIPTPSKRQRAS